MTLDFSESKGGFPGAREEEKGYTSARGEWEVGTGWWRLSTELQRRRKEEERDEWGGRGKQWWRPGSLCTE